MSDYLISFTDPAKNDFVVKPWTANGPVTPAANTPLLPGAVTANTSLAIVGKGRFEYGENVQENLVRMLEHFAYVTAPSFAIEGQLWNKNTTGEMFLYDGVDWNALIVSGKNTTDIDLNGVVLQNIGTAVLPTDALNKVAADLIYVSRAGSTMTGLLILSGDPVNNFGAATKQYVDNLLSGSTTFVQISGSTMTGSLIMDSADITITSGQLILTTSTFDGGGAVLENITDSLDPQSAVTRGYVDSLPFTTGTVDTAEYDGTTDILVLTRLGDSAVNSNQIITNTVINNDPLYTDSLIRDQVYPVPLNIPQAISLLDRAASSATRRVKRHLFTNSTATDYTLPFLYNVETDRLLVFKNNTKLYRASRAVGKAEFNTYNTSASLLAIPEGYYNYNITVDGLLQTNVLVNVNQPFMYNSLLASILNAQLAQSGLQTVSFSTPLVDGTEITGYSALTYEADITVDGIMSSISIDGSLVLTINDLVTELLNQLNSVSVFVYNGKLVVKSLTTGTSSVISINDSTYTNKIFTDLTNFSAINTAVNGYTLGHTSGYQSIIFNGPVDNADTSGLSATPYTVDITVDGTLYTISVTDGASELPTIDDLLVLINNELVGVATASISTLIGSPTIGSIIIVSNTDGSTSTIAISDPGGATGLFSNLTNFSTINSSVDGVAGVRVIYEDGALLWFSPSTTAGTEITLAAPSSGTDLFSILDVTVSNETLTLPYDYTENGEVFERSNSITFAAPLIITDVVECVVLPGAFNSLI